MTRKKKIIIILSIFLMGILTFAGVQYYIYMNPTLEFFILRSGSKNGDYYVEFLSLTDSSPYLLPPHLTEQMNEYAELNQEVMDEIYSHQKPLNISVDVKFENNKTYVTYYGIVTGEDGEKIDYNRELVFDFVITDNLNGQ